MQGNRQDEQRHEHAEPAAVAHEVCAEYDEAENYRDEKQQFLHAAMTRFRPSRLAR